LLGMLMRAVTVTAEPLTAIGFGGLSMHCAPESVVVPQWH